MYKAVKLREISTLNPFGGISSQPNLDHLPGPERTGVSNLPAHAQAQPYTHHILPSAKSLVISLSKQPHQSRITHPTTPPARKKSRQQNTVAMPECAWCHKEESEEVKLSHFDCARGRAGKRAGAASTGAFRGASST